MPQIPAPQLASIIGKEIWCRPANASDTTPATWCELVAVTELDDHGMTMFRPWIVWHGDEPGLMGTPGMLRTPNNIVTYKE